MHPAPSVILFTTLSGFGFGLIFWLCLGFGTASGWSAFWLCFICGALAVIGLSASTFHLGHPERALKAFTQWRSSWLSREGVVSVVTLLAFGLYTLLWVFADTRLALLGWITAALAALTVFCTAMIYTQLKTIPRWNTALTPLKFMLFTLAIPALLFGLPLIAVGYLIVLAVIQYFHWRAGDTAMADRGHTPESATGLGHLGTASLLEAPHSEANYLMKEMVFTVARDRAKTLRLITMILGFAVPILIGLIGMLTTGLPLVWLVIAVLAHAIGTVTSRWLFFAEAQHVVSLYYGHR
jgi:DMSO reductase anchor subunit